MRPFRLLAQGCNNGAVHSDQERMGELWWLPSFIESQISKLKGVFGHVPTNDADCKFDVFAGSIGGLRGIIVDASTYKFFQ